MKKILFAIFISLSFLACSSNAGSASPESCGCKKKKSCCSKSGTCSSDAGIDGEHKTCGSEKSTCSGGN